MEIVVGSCCAAAVYVAVNAANLSDSYIMYVGDHARERRSLSGPHLTMWPSIALRLESVPPVSLVRLVLGILV